MSNLKLTVSTKEDVKNVFGSDCDGGCDYDAIWKIDFNYFGGITIEKTVDNKKIKYVHKKDLIGKISSISFTPKQSIPFS